MLVKQSLLVLTASVLSPCLGEGGCSLPRVKGIDLGAAAIQSRFVFIFFFPSPVWQQLQYSVLNCFVFKMLLVKSKR